VYSGGGSEVLYGGRIVLAMLLRVLIEALSSMSGLSMLGKRVSNGDAKCYEKLFRRLLGFLAFWLLYLGIFMSDRG
jgi:hypothetical protein